MNRDALHRLLAGAGLVLGSSRNAGGFQKVNANIKVPIEFDSAGSDSAFTGSCGASGVVVTEIGDDAFHKTVFDMALMPMTFRDAQQGGGQLLYTFPKGRIFVLGAYATIQPVTHSAIATTLNSGITAQWGLGTTTQANATLATTEQDLIPNTAWTSGTTIDVAPAATYGALAAAAAFDGTAAAKQAFLNLACVTATDVDGDASMLVNGRVEIVWALIGAKAF